MKATCKAVSLSFFFAIFSLGIKAQSRLPDSPRYLIPQIEKSDADTNRIVLLNKLGSFYLLKTGNFKTDLDSAQLYLNQALQLSERLNSRKWINEILQVKGNSYLEGEDMVNGSACFKKVIAYFQQTRDVKAEANTWVRFGDCITSDHLKEAINCYQHALDLIPDTTNRIHVNMLQAIGSCYIQMGDLKTGESYYKALTDHYHQVGNIRKEASLWILMARFYTFGYAAKKAACFTQGLSLLKRLPVRNKQQETDVLKEIADAHLANGRVDLAEQELKQVLVDYRAIGYKNLQFTYDLLGNVYALKGEPQKELDSYLQSVDYMRASGDTTAAQYFYLKIGRAYQSLGFPKKSIFYFDKALFGSISYNATSYAEAVYYKTHSLISQGKTMEALSFLTEAVKQHPPKHSGQQMFVSNGFAECYQALGEYTRAEKYFMVMAGIADTFKNSTYQDQYEHVNYLVSNLYVAMKDYSKADHYLQRIGIIRPGILTVDEQGRLNLLHFKIDSAFGRYASAIAHYQLYIKFKDSIFNATKNKQLQEVETRYEIKEKERSIAGFKNREKLQHAELEKVNTQRNITLIGIVLVLIIAGLAYNGFRQKRRSNLSLEASKKEIDQKNETLQKLNFKQELLLIEKEWLLREIHHRVKNNLQTTISLLHMQSAYLSNEEALSAIRNSQRRMQAMSLIHQKLYQSESMTNIVMSDYIAELINYLKESFRGSANISFELQVKPLELDVSQAIPLGLIINEAITNSIKYAFPDNRKGTISVVLKTGPDGHNILIIADDGIGLPVLFDADSHHNSLGLNLIRGLTDQLQGEFSIKSDNGTVLTIIFKDAATIKEEDLLKINHETSKG